MIVKTNYTKSKADSTIHPDTSMGAVHLTVSKLDRSLDFYERCLGFQVHNNNNKTAHLGAGADDLLILTEIPGAKLIHRRTGLYHFAILVPSRMALAQSLHNLIETETKLGGGADHLVSEALYLSDPDGNGIEIYRDRPQSEWVQDNGTIKMDTLPLDFEGIHAELDGSKSNWDGLNSDTRIGHVHLYVANLDEAQDFYENVLGLDLTLSLAGSASFFRAGDYHHHIGVNTWNGIGIPPPPPDSAGLRHFTIILPNGEETKLLTQRLKTGGIQFERDKSGIFVRDPSQNGILFTTRD